MVVSQIYHTRSVRINIRVGRNKCLYTYYSSDPMVCLTSKYVLVLRMLNVLDFVLSWYTVYRVWICEETACSPEATH